MHPAFALGYRDLSITQRKYILDVTWHFHLMLVVGRKLSTRGILKFLLVKDT